MTRMIRGNLLEDREFPWEIGIFIKAVSFRFSTAQIEK